MSVCTLSLALIIVVDGMEGSNDAGLGYYEASLCKIMSVAITGENNTLVYTGIRQLRCYSFGFTPVLVADI